MDGIHVRHSLHVLPSSPVRGCRTRRWHRAPIGPRAWGAPTLGRLWTRCRDREDILGEEAGAEWVEGWGRAAAAGRDAQTEAERGIVRGWRAEGRSGRRAAKAYQHCRQTGRRAGGRVARSARAGGRQAMRSSVSAQRPDVRRAASECERHQPIAATAGRPTRAGQCARVPPSQAYRPHRCVSFPSVLPSSVRRADSAAGRLSSRLVGLRRWLQRRHTGEVDQRARGQTTETRREERRGVAVDEWIVWRAGCALARR